MSEENVEIVRRVYESLDQLGVGETALVEPEGRARFEELCHPDFELTSFPGLGDASGTFRGYEGLRAFVRALDEVFEDIKFIPGRHVADGDFVVVAVAAEGTGKGSGGRPGMEIAHLWELDAARAKRCVVHEGFDAALEAAGLSE